ncbi:MAG: hypothetical protein COT55_00255 [Candidatus Diapherotrites archaeon CG09_land_8_20_14_0_10_32_12]|nr:MAG: hypothetical protein COT55_00255 [Candidatus Diapherotrites archaeon CG09_land_8_20_14_0_10_32_12]
MKEIRTKLILLFLFVVLSIIVVNTMSTIGTILLTYLIVISGIYISLAYMVITFILYKNNLPTESWILFSVVAIFLAASSFFGRFMNNLLVAEQFLALSMVLLFVAALMKFWSTMALTEKKKKIIKQKKKRKRK